jgi:phosphoserine aminotransferase
MQKPALRPLRPYFSSGPCAKRPGWDLSVLSSALLGRSHRAKDGKARINEVIRLSRTLLNLPENYHIGIMPASDTGAFEAAMWSLLGPRPVDVFAWESFSDGWVTDAVKQLKLKDTNVYQAPYGQLPDLTKANPKHDIVFCWNGTTSGVVVPDGNWISADREGLTLCDATSAVFAYDMPWDKIDVLTYSWQKVLGGEAQHGILILSPRAVERLESYTPAWPLPKLFRLTKKGKLNEAIFSAETINTPSMLCIEDVLDALTWAHSIGGAPAMVARSKASLAHLNAWVQQTPWVAFLAEDPAIRSHTSVCLTLTDPAFLAKDDAGQRAFIKALVDLLEKEGVALDINAYRDAPPGLRIWCGATVEPDDVKALLPWITWAFETLKPTV